MTHHHARDEGAGGIQPVYDLAYRVSTAGTDMSWIQEYRFGGGGGEWTDNEARDTDTADPNVLDVFVPVGSASRARSSTGGPPVAASTCRGWT